LWFQLTIVRSGDARQRDTRQEASESRAVAVRAWENMEDCRAAWWVEAATRVHANRLVELALVVHAATATSALHPLGFSNVSAALLLPS